MVYLIPFCESVKTSIVGNVNGYFEFVGLKDYLEIAFPSAPIQQTSGATASGFARYCFENGAVARNDVTNDSVVATLKANIDPIPALSETGTTASVLA